MDHVYSISAGGKDLSKDVQITVIGPIKLEIREKNFRNLSEKLGGKFPNLAV